MFSQPETMKFRIHPPAAAIKAMTKARVEKDFIGQLAESVFRPKFSGPFIAIS
jgi:hypothetical protein